MLFAMARTRGMMEGAGNVEFLLGDSAECVKTILEKEADSPIVWFLDSHYSSGETGRGSCDVPLLLELRAIAAARRPYSDVIVIDDHRLFGTQHAEDWSGITEEAI